MPVAAASGLSGRNEPANGAPPLEMWFAAVSSKIVPVKLAPLKPRFVASGTTVALGVMSCNARSPSKVWVMFTVTLISWTVCVSGTAIVLDAPVELLSGMAMGGRELGKLGLVFLMVAKV